MKFRRLQLVLASAIQFAPAAPADCDDDGYSMYVWTRGFDPSAPHCGGVYPPDRDGDNASCFIHNWDTAAARERLWASCSNPGREVTRLFVADMKDRIEHGGHSDVARTTCDSDVMALLTEAHRLGVRVYALFSDSTAEFNESYMAAYPNQFNANCGTDEAYFDGVAVNNEHFANIKSCDADGENTIYVAEQQDHLDKLQLTADNAAPLPLHFSVSWNWRCCSCSGGLPRLLEWPTGGGSVKTVTAHMIDIADSVDVQVAYIKSSTMASRSAPAYDDWSAKPGKSETSRVYTLAYTNPTSLCQTSFSPHVEGSAAAEDGCSIGNPRTEEGMFQGFDYVEAQLPGIRGSIHFMNGVYGSGITAGWPVHSPGPTPSCLPGPSTPSPTSSPSTAPTSPPSHNPTEAPPGTAISFLTFEEGNDDQATFVNAAGSLIYPDCFDPDSSSAINPSSCSGRYLRNSAITWDWCLFQTSAIVDASLFWNGDLVFEMDAFTHDAPVGTRIDVTIEDSSVTANRDFPSGRHSRYTAATTTRGEWERLRFVPLDRPDPSVGGGSISAIVISFAPGQLGDGSAYYIDNLNGVPSDGSTPSPTARLTSSPSTGPSNAGLTSSPSPFDPCADDEDWVFITNKGKTKGCWWVGRNTRRRCKGKFGIGGDGNVAEGKDACPSKCDENCDQVSNRIFV